MHSWESETGTDTERPAYYAIDGRDGKAFFSGFEPSTNNAIYSYDNCFKSSTAQTWMKVYLNWVYIVEAIVLQVKSTLHMYNIYLTGHAVIFQLELVLNFMLIIIIFYT